MGYSIKILSNHEFEKLPYKHAPIALGVADPRTNTAYVRYSSHPELQKYLIDHEFEHLVEDTPTDEIEGVRYKIPILGPLASGIGNVARSAAPVIGRGISSIGSGISHAAGGLYNAGRSVIGGIGSALGGAGNSIMSAFQRQPSITSSVGSPSPSSPQGGGGGIFSGFNLPQTLLGAGLTGLGLFKKLPKAPQNPASIEQLRSQAQSGGSPIGQLGQSKLTEQLNQNYNPLSQPEIEASLRQLELEQRKAEDQVRDLYKNLRPGTDPSTDTSFQRDLAQVQDQFSRAKADTLATRTRETKQIFDQQRSIQIQQALGASDQQMEFLKQIAQYDVDRIATQLGLDYESARLFKETFLGLGQDLLTSGLGAFQQSPY